MAKRRLCALVLALAALGLYLFENNTGTRALLAAALVLPLGSAGLFLLTRPRLTARLEVPPSLKRGEEAQCALILEREGWAPLWTVEYTVEVRNRFTGEGETVTGAVALGTRRRLVARVALTVAHCGRVSVKVTGLRALDLFGLAAKKMPPAAEAGTTVSPVLRAVDVALDETADLLTDSQRYSTQKPGNDPSETFRIRDYAPGDPIRRIHWKLTEKLDKTLVRDFGLPAEERVLLTLEPASCGWEEVDQDLDLLFSVGRTLCEMEHPCTVSWPVGGGSDILSLHDEEDWAVFRSQLLSTPMIPVRLSLEGLLIL